MIWVTDLLSQIFTSKKDITGLSGSDWNLGRGVKVRS